MLFCILIAGLLSACAALYEHHSEIPTYHRLGKTIAIGESRQQVRKMLGVPLLDVPSLGLEVYRQSDRYFGIGWVFAPWAPVPAWGDKEVAVILVVYDKQGMVKAVDSGLWEWDHRFEQMTVDAGGFQFFNIPLKQPATMLSPPISPAELSRVVTDQEHCSLFFMMAHCPMETIRLDGHEIADFPYLGRRCDVGNQKFSPVLFDSVLWARTTPGSHRIHIHLRMRSGDFERSFDCQPGDNVFIELRGREYVPDKWHGPRLLGSLHLIKGTGKQLGKLLGLRIILWHEGTWYGFPIMKYAEPE